MKHNPPDSPGAPRAVRPAVLMLGKGWFPTELGGLDRYFRDLFEALAQTEWSATGIVVGPAEDAPERLTAVSAHRAPLRSLTDHDGATLVVAAVSGVVRAVDADHDPLTDHDAVLDVGVVP